MMHEKSRKVRNLKRSTNITLSIMIEAPEIFGEERSKVSLVYGNAELAELSDEEFKAFRTLALEKYLTKEELASIDNIDMSGWIKVIVKPDKIIFYHS